MAEKKGIDISGLRNCPKCGSSNPADARHCVNCGARLDEKAQVQKIEEPKKEGIIGRLFGRRKAA